jgi:nicotinate-nucleotide adenylyltransferase
MEKTVALFGGSFNPPHEGHLRTAAYLHRTLGVDETWMLFSVNPEKNPSCYAPLEHRINMAKLLARHFDTPIVMSDLEAKIADEKGRLETYYILEGLKERFPQTKFIFAMGADTFAGFHLWDERDDIMKSTPIAVLDRPGYREKAMQSPTAAAFKDTCIDVVHPETLKDAESGWCYMNNPQVDISSSDITNKIKAGKPDFDGMFAEVHDYICLNGLYGTSGNSNLRHAI